MAINIILVTWIKNAKNIYGGQETHGNKLLDIKLFPMFSTPVEKQAKQLVEEKRH